MARHQFFPLIGLLIVGIIGVHCHSWLPSLQIDLPWIQHGTSKYSAKERTNNQEQAGVVEVVKGSIDQLDQINPVWVCTNQKTGAQMIFGTEIGNGNSAKNNGFSPQQESPLPTAGNWNGQSQQVPQYNSQYRVPQYNNDPQQQVPQYNAQQQVPHQPVPQYNPQQQVPYQQVPQYNPQQQVPYLQIPQYSPQQVPYQQVPQYNPQQQVPQQQVPQYNPQQVPLQQVPQYNPQQVPQQQVPQYNPQQVPQQQVPQYNPQKVPQQQVPQYNPQQVPQNNPQQQVPHQQVPQNNIQQQAPQQQVPQYSSKQQVPQQQVPQNNPQRQAPQQQVPLTNSTHQQLSTNDSPQQPHANTASTTTPAIFVLPDKVQAHQQLSATKTTAEDQWNIKFDNFNWTSYVTIKPVTTAKPIEYDGQGIIEARIE